MRPHSLIPIHAAQPTPPAGASERPAGCGGCLHSAQNTPVCRASVALPCAATQLVGPQDELRRVLTGLGRRLGFAPEAPEQAGVLALTLSPGEAELRLAGSGRCAGTGAAQAEAAFQALRSLLPDTDIYVTHAG